MKRIMVVPDVHGRVFWKDPVKKYIDAVDIDSQQCFMIDEEKEEAIIAIKDYEGLYI